MQEAEKYQKARNLYKRFQCIHTLCIVLYICGPFLQRPAWCIINGKAADFPSKAYFHCEDDGGTDSEGIRRVPTFGLWILPSLVTDLLFIICQLVFIFSIHLTRKFRHCSSDQKVTEKFLNILFVISIVNYTQCLIYSTFIANPKENEVS